jgi:hypothetical protein
VLYALCHIAFAYEPETGIDFAYDPQDGGKHDLGQVVEDECPIGLALNPLPFLHKPALQPTQRITLCINELASMN